MTLGRRSIFVVLVALYVGAVWVRLDRLNQSPYPYYDGESATHFRYTQLVADDGRLPAADPRASRPDAYSPSRVMPTGVEYFAGYVLRLFRPFTDVPDKRFTGILSILVFSLSVFTFYAFTRAAWRCQAAGGFAAVLVAFSAPLVGATSGREFLHAPYAFLVVSFHLALFAAIPARPSAGRIVGAALAVLALASLTTSAGLYVALFGLFVLVSPGISSETRRAVLAWHLVAMVLAAIAFPHLRADRFIFSWPVAWLFVATAYSFLADKLPPRLPKWSYGLGAFIALALLFSVLRRGSIDLLDPLTYWYYRLRFIAGKPDDPSLLPAMVRVAWTENHAPPSWRTILVFFLPLALLLIPAAGVLRGVKKEKGIAVWPFVAAAVAGTAVFLLDARAVLAAAVVAFPFVSGAFRGFGTHLRTRALPAAAALVLMAAGWGALPGSMDVFRIVGDRLGLPERPQNGFVRASIGNADRELVRFLVTRTSTRSDVVLAPPVVSSLVVAFAGRSTVVVSGIETREMAARTVDVLSGFYSDEDAFFDQCRNLGATYVVYSIDIFLDQTRYSPRYTAAASGDVDLSLAYEMQFAPEKLRHFQLVYENDNYRAFRVTTEPQPVFIGDHPPVYQEEIFRTFGGDRAAFYARILDVLTTYQTAVAAQAKGDEQGAIRRFQYCLDYAPRFSAARLGVGDSLLRLGRPREAQEAYGSVLQYAPDNTHALYYGALSLAYTGRRDEALRLVELLLTATADRWIRADALELKAALESGQPVEMPAPRASDASNPQMDPGSR